MGTSVPEGIARAPNAAHRRSKSTRWVIGGALALAVACRAPEREPTPRVQPKERTPAPAGGRTAERPNVLFISVDDLNDWVGPLGGHPQAKTPNLDALARTGVTFTHNYAPSPACNPSRTATMTGRHPHTTGVYSNYQYWREVIPDVELLPRYFGRQGYWAAGAGKILHNDQPDPPSWDAYFPSRENHMPEYHYPDPGRTVNMPAFDQMYGDFDWAPIELGDEETGDARTVKWVIDELGEPRERPFFLACGIYRPHLPWYVPKKYFDMFPIETVQLPRHLDDDQSDLGERAREIAARGGDYHRHVVDAGKWQEAVQGYLASIAYTDALVGRLMEGLEETGHVDDTIVVLWSDHGWQLGEKRHWRKFALWENVLRTVLMIRVPAGAPGLTSGTSPGARVDQVTSLVDLFPTLVELAGLPPKEQLDGTSLVPLLRDPTTTADRAVVSTYDYSEFSVRTGRWRYIRYIDGTEELYDHDTDPEEWRNLAGSAEHADVLATMRAHVPDHPAPLVPTTYPLQAHHVPPFRDRDHYFEYRRRRGTSAPGKSSKANSGDSEDPTRQPESDAAVGPL